MTSPPGPRPNESEPPAASEPERDEFDDDDARAEETRPGLDRILPELLRKGFEAGRGPLERVSESFFPKDIAANLASQLGDMRSGVVKAVAQEVGRFLRDADIATELRKVLTGLDIEATLKLRFKARDDGSLKPEIKLEDAPGDKPRASDRRKR